MVNHALYAKVFLHQVELREDTIGSVEILLVKLKDEIEVTHGGDDAELSKIREANVDDGKKKKKMVNKEAATCIGT